MDERREKERIKAIREKHPHLVGDTLPHNHTIRELIDIAPFIESVQTTIQADITDGHDHDGSNSVKVDWGDLDNRPSTFPPEDHDHVVGDITDFPATMPPSSHTHPTTEISDYPSEFPPEDHEHVLDDITDYVEPEQGLRPSDLFGLGKEGYVIDPWELTANKNVNDGYAGLNSSGYVAHGQLGSGGGGSSKFLREDNSWQTVAVGSSAAEDIVFTPYGNIATTDVQAAIQELDDEKAVISHTHGSVAVTNLSVTSSSNGLSLIANPIIAVQASGTSVHSSGTLQFVNSNGITFGLTSNSLTGSFSQSTHAHDFMSTSERGNYFYTSNQTFANSTHAHGSIAGTNISVTSVSSGLSLSVGNQSTHDHPYMGTGERNNYFYSSANTFANSTHTHGSIAKTGNISFTSASSGLSVSISNYLTTAAQSGHTHGSAPSITGSISITSSSNAWSISIPSFLTTAAVSNHTHGSSPSITGSISVTSSSNAWSISIPSFLTTAAAVTHTHSASNVSDFSEAVCDAAGAMFTGNTETGITATYQDADNTVDLVVTPFDVVGGRLDYVSTTSLKWSFYTSNQIKLFNPTTEAWELVQVSSEPTLANTANDLNGTALAVDKIYDIFAEYSSATAFNLVASRWAVSTAGSSARNAAYNSGTAYAIGDRVTSGGNDYTCIQAGTNKTPASEPTYWVDNGTSVTGDFAGLYRHDGILVSDSSTTGKKRRWLGVIYTYNNSSTVNFKDDSNKRLISNYYNIKNKTVISYNTTTTSYTCTATSWRESNAGTNNVRGFFLACRTQSVLSILTGSGNNGSGYTYISYGINSTSTPNGTPFITIGWDGVFSFGGEITVSTGYQFITLIEQTSAGTSTIRSQDYSRVVVEIGA